MDAHSREMAEPDSITDGDTLATLFSTGGGWDASGDTQVAPAEADDGADPLEDGDGPFEDLDQTDEPLNGGARSNGGGGLDPIALYLKDVGGGPLLTAEQEIALARRIEAGRRAQKRLDRDGVDPEKRAELRQIVLDGLEAREHLIRANSRLVINIAKRYVGRGVPFLDLVQEGNIGLMRTTRKFDYRLGYKFSTYATWWIRQAITRAIAEQSRTVRVPVHVSDQITQTMRTVHQLTQELGREPTCEELADAMEIPRRKVEELLRLTRGTLSLEKPLADEVDTDLGDFIEDEDSQGPDEVVAASMLRDLLGEMLQGLPPRTVRILQLRYGLVDGETYTLEEVGKKLGVTRERVRQIETQALSRLRHPTHTRRLKDFLGK